MNQFTKRLQKLKGKASGKRADAEDEARADYAAQIERIRHQRRLFRKMKLEAIQERQKLLDSMAIQKDDEELLKRKVPTLRFLLHAFLTTPHPALQDPRYPRRGVARRQRIFP